MMMISTLATCLMVTASVCEAQSFEIAAAAHESGDYKKEASEYMLLAEQGDPYAQLFLGGMYERGLGVSQSYETALRLYQVSATQGEFNAQGALGSLYRDGKGTPQSYLLAHMWFNIASANGLEGAAKARDALAVKMTPEDVSKAQAMAQKCLKTGYKRCS